MRLTGRGACPCRPVLEPRVPVCEYVERGVVQRELGIGRAARPSSAGDCVLVVWLWASANLWRLDGWVRISAVCFVRALYGVGPFGLLCCARLAFE